MIGMDDEILVPSCEFNGVVMPAITIKDINSQVAEQGHAKLTNIATKVAFMKQAHFLDYTKYYLCRVNMRIKEKWTK
jgi:hypothetical protein